ncbi:MAG: hypothetical protein FWG00_06620, partial [Coriobacteriia bacterium]|nr:hypothetical protein [Coriobacteriia bacterium]
SVAKLKAFLDPGFFTKGFFDVKKKVLLGFKKGLVGGGGAKGVWAARPIKLEEHTCQKSPQKIRLLILQLMRP